MLGNALLVYPVTDKEAKAVSVLLPGLEEDGTVIHSYTDTWLTAKWKKEKNR